MSKLTVVADDGQAENDEEESSESAEWPVSLYQMCLRAAGCYDLTR